MRTIVHIGQHKTATTSIQRHLRNNKAKLQARGLYVPDSLAGIDHPSHYVLNVFALAEGRSSTMKEQMLRTRGHDFVSGLGDVLKEDIEAHYRRAMEGGCQAVIWSNEGLYLLNSEAEYQKLKELFAPYSSEVVAVCCFRDKEAYRTSYLSQLKKLNAPLSKDKTSHRYLERDSWLFDYDSKKKLLRKCFDKSVFFDYCQDDNVGRFMSVIGFETPDSASPRLNVSDTRQ